MKIYTKQGDDGATGLYGGGRLSKDDLRIEAYGTLDELSAHLGAVRAERLAADVDQLLQSVQCVLFVIGAQLAAPGAAPSPAGEVQPSDIVRLEQAIDRLDADLPPLQNFILPGGCALSAALHVARVVCRRAERRVVSLDRQQPIHPQIVPYLNRLSDLLFVMARAENDRAGVPDVPWQP